MNIISFSKEIKKNDETYYLLQIGACERLFFLEIINVLKSKNAIYLPDVKKWIIKDCYYSNAEELIQILYDEYCKNKNIIKQENINIVNEIQQKIKENLLNEYENVEYSDEFYVIRKEKFKKENGKCEICKNDGKNCHHIIPVRFGGLNTVENLMFLCSNCHAKIHSLYSTIAIQKIFLKDCLYFKNVIKNFKKEINNGI